MDSNPAPTGEPNPAGDELPLDPALIAEIDALEPAYPVPDSVGRVTAEALEHLVVHVLALEDIHELLWHGYADGRFSDQEGALWAERAAEVLSAWLRDHGIAQIAFWYPSRVLGDRWAQFKISAAD